MTDPNSAARAIFQAIRADVQRMIDASQRRQTGAQAGGPYNSFTLGLDGRITWAGTAGSLAATKAYNSGSPPTINNGVSTAFAFNADTAGWWAGVGSPTLITVPVTGVFLTIARPEWATDNTTGGRYFEIVQLRSGGAVDGTSFLYPHGETSYRACPSLSWRWDVVAGDSFEFYNEHSGGVNTLKCDLSVWFQQIG